MPPGLRWVGGHWYWRPTDAATRALRDRLYPGRNSVPAGSSNSKNDSARAWWAATILPALTDAPAIDAPKPGTVREIIDRYRREILPTLPDATAAEDRRYCIRLEQAFGDRPYATSEVDAAKGTFVRTMDISRHLRSPENQKRPVAANREIQCFARMFGIAKSLWGYTEYNPCLQAMYNVETPRSVYIDDAMFMMVYKKALPILQCMMDLAQMHAARRGMLLRMTLATITEDGVLLPLNKKKKTDVQRYQRILWTDELREVVNRALELRRKARGGQSQVADLASAPLFLNRKGKAITVSGFNSMWYRARSKAGFAEGEFHFHDIKAKSMSDSPDVVNAMERGGHVDLRMAKRVYRRKPTDVIPMPKVSNKPGKRG